MLPSVVLKGVGAALVAATWLISAVDGVSDGVKLALLAAGFAVGYAAVRMERGRGRAG